MWNDFKIGKCCNPKYRKTPTSAYNLFPSMGCHLSKSSSCYWYSDDDNFGGMIDFEHDAGLKITKFIEKFRNKFKKNKNNTYYISTKEMDSFNENVFKIILPHLSATQIMKKIKSIKKSAYERGMSDAKNEIRKSLGI